MWSVVFFMASAFGIEAPTPSTVDDADFQTRIYKDLIHPFNEGSVSFSNLIYKAANARMNMLAEASTKDISVATNPKNFEESKKVAKQGGNVAKVARKELELQK